MRALKLNMKNTDELLIETGSWLYAGSVECIVHLVERNVAYGSGDSEDPIEVREDRDGVFYYLKMSDPTAPGKFSTESGAFESIEKAKGYAGKVCSELVWK
ncbi:MAG: hypothetical protein COB04_15200 [Gammaproteobacteria bacterium]|nr:MAG: hypothetical protein COB04_15200 [Gammaproteobacteria bacterium]